MMFKFFILLSGLLFSTAVFAQGRASGDPERLKNNKPDYHQYEGQIVKVKDADTITVKIYLLPGLVYTVDVRSKGVDSPELDSNSPCDWWEKKLANEAKQAIEKRFPVDSWVYIENIENGSFSGRIIADIKQRYSNQRWRTVTKILLEKEGLWGVPYVRNKSFDWCQSIPSD